MRSKRFPIDFLSRATRFYTQLCWSIRQSVRAFFQVFAVFGLNAPTSNTAHAHPHATGVAAYTALFSLRSSRPTRHTKTKPTSLTMCAFRPTGGGHQSTPSVFDSVASRLRVITTWPSSTSTTESQISRIVIYIYASLNRR